MNYRGSQNQVTDTTVHAAQTTHLGTGVSVTITGAAGVGYYEGGIPMKQWIWRCALGLSLAVVSGALGQRGVPPEYPTTEKSDDVRLPNGKLQKDEILKAEHEQNLKDAAQLTELAQQVQQELEKDDRFVVSLSTIKKTEDIEKLAKKIRGRLRHN